MKIIRLLQYGVILSVLVFIVLGTWIFSINKNYIQTKNTTDIAQKINDDTFQINTLTSDYLLYYQERASQQWKKTYTRLSKMLDNKKIESIQGFIDIGVLRKTHERSLHLFKRLEEIKKQNGINKKDAFLIQSQIKALASQLLTTTQLMTLTAKKLIDAVRIERLKLEQQLYWVALVIFTIFIISLFFIWLTLAYRVVIPVRLLKEHISNINAENLNKKYENIRDDEIGELAESFNRLSDDLFTTTVSKEKLVEEIRERKKTTVELVKQQDLNTTVLEGASNIITILDTNGNFVNFNHSAEELTGYLRDEIIGKPIWDFVIAEEEREDVKKVFSSLIKGNDEIAGHHENHWVTKAGDYRLIEWHNTVVRNAVDGITHVVAIGYDITEKRFNEKEKQRIQRELSQSRKMEALGKLTGGIAHDFNNMLGIIIGYTDLAIDKSSEDHNSLFTGYLEQIQIASNRAKDLIAKMLAFSRVDQAASHSLQLAPLLDENMKLMTSILPSTIKLAITKENNVPDIIMDPVQFQQLLMNLIINAKDAMDGVGEINLSLGRYNSLGKECSSCHQKIIGNWVEVIISDNGTGMSKEVEERIFDPFFTTKEPGQGTGMGLSVVHGIVKGHKGHIIINSNFGKGTAFHLLFPPVAGESKLPSTDDDEGEKNIRGGGQRILIIDDQESLANIQYEILNSYGYQCTKKYDSEEALNLFLSDITAFDLILTDQTMPNLTGLELIDKIRKNNIDIPVIIMTGYSDKIKDSKLNIKNVTLLFKPVDTSILLKHVARLLGLSKV